MGRENRTDGTDAEGGGGGATSEHDLAALRATQEEARTVLDHQLQTLNDVDDKAAMTSRLNVLLLGLLFTAGSFFARADAFDATPYFNRLTWLGTVLLVVSFGLAITTYTTTTVETGPGPRDLLRLIDVQYSEEEWLLLLLRSEAKWMSVNERRQSLNGVLLTASHSALVLAIVALTAGAAVIHW